MWVKRSGYVPLRPLDLWSTNRLRVSRTDAHLDYAATALMSASEVSVVEYNHEISHLQLSFGKDTMPSRYKLLLHY
jgi:hypothetical protein